MNEDKATEAVEHLQAAALELIAAARAVLDVAEDLVREPAAAATIVSAAASMGRATLGRKSADPPGREPPPAQGRVRHIHVS